MSMIAHYWNAAKGLFEPKNLRCTEDGGMFVVEQGLKAGGLYNTDGTWPKTEVCLELQKYISNVKNYTARPTGVVDTAEITEVTLTAGNKTTAFTIKPWGGAGFRGYYYTVGAASLAEAATRLRGNTGSVDCARDFAPVGEVTPYKGTSEVTKIHFLAVDTEGAEDNNGEITPY